jgi:hypothetical protein
MPKAGGVDSDTWAKRPLYKGGEKLPFNAPG